MTTEGIKPWEPVRVRYTHVDGSVGSNWMFDDDDWVTMNDIGDGGAPYTATVTLANGQTVIVRAKQ